MEKSLNSLLFQDKIKMLLFSQQGHVKNSQCDTQDFIWESNWDHEHTESFPVVFHQSEISEFLDNLAVKIKAF